MDGHGSMGGGTPRHINEAWAARAAELAAWAAAHLVVRVDVYGGYLPIESRRQKRRDDGSVFTEKTTTHPRVRDRGKVQLTTEVLRRHFVGADVGDIVGLHTTDLKDTCRWFLIEVDAHDGDAHADPERNWRATLHWRQKLVDAGCDVLVTDSNGRGGYHMLVMLSDRVASARVYAFAQHVVSDFASLGMTQPPETFPKQARVTGRGKELGNWARLPGRHHTRDHWSRVWDHAGARWLDGPDAVSAILAFTATDAAKIPPEPVPETPKNAKPRRDLPAFSGARDAAKNRQVALLALQHIPNSDCHFDRWLAVGMALHYEGCSVQDWIGWSKNSGKHTDGECERRWDTFSTTTGRPATVGSLIKYARDAGFDPMPRRKRNPSPGGGNDDAGDDEDDGADAAPRVQAAIEAARENRNVAAAFDVAADLASMPRADVEVAIAEFRHALGRDLSVRELRKEIKRLAHRGPALLPSTGEPSAGILDKADPLPTARKFLDDHWTHTEGRLLVYSADTLYGYTGAAYEPLEDAALGQQLYRFLERHTRMQQIGDSLQEVAFKPTKGDLALVTDALEKEVYTPVRSPAWLDGADGEPDPCDLLVARNGVVDLTDPAMEVQPNTPRLFVTNSFDTEINFDALEPTQWIRFLDQLWPDDPESIELLQDWFGYCLTPDTRQQKILLIIGPKRSGKGTIARVIRKMVGHNNVCAPTLGSLATNFGLQPLLNKTLATISDARLGARTDKAVIVERLLSISGEDDLTVDRKNLTAVTTKLVTRFLICTNEVPHLDDSSAAMASRFLVLKLTESHIDKEDKFLTGKLFAEMPGILNWSIAGWKRLRERGRFMQPGAGQELVEALTALASPISVFLSDWCEVNMAATVEVKDLYDAWALWCEQEGEKRVGTVQTFGRALQASVPGITKPRPRDEDGGRVRHYGGVRLRLHAREALNVDRARKHYNDQPGPHVSFIP